LRRFRDAPRFCGPSGLAKTRTFWKKEKNHIHKAHNPASKYYNSPFYTALRDHLTDFTVRIGVGAPWFVQHLRHYEGENLE